MTYAYQLAATYPNGEMEVVGPVRATAVPRAEGAVRLLVTPNPARGAVIIGLVEARPVAIYDALGRCVRRLAPAGWDGAQMLLWDGRDAHGRPVGRGTYYLRLEGGGQPAAARLTWLC